MTILQSLSQELTLLLSQVSIYDCGYNDVHEALNQLFKCNKSLVTNEYRKQALKNFITLFDTRTEVIVELGISNLDSLHKLSDLFNRIELAINKGE